MQLITVKLAEGELTLPVENIAAALANKILNTPERESGYTHVAHKIANTCMVPDIGSEWPGQGGIYAGIIRGRDGRPSAHLIVGPELGDEIKWKAAMDAAKKLKEGGHKDFTLPYREEQSLMYANVPELFEKTWYWSCEQHASNSDYAWLQDFGGGYQCGDIQGGGRRARAVRRLPIE
jgi:hypothetical protein